MRDHLHDGRRRADAGRGIGHLSRKYGLAIDNLLAADMVLADGSTVTASEDQNQDLFWACAGAAGISAP